MKIADFGVARLAAHEGVITRVGTNIYAAPEHNPLVQTGSLDLGAIAAGHDHLTPAADIYSLAKTTYALLAGESPRRFAQHSIKEMPAVVTNHFWSGPVLEVLEKATQLRPENRYQTVQEFWDDLADATLPPTRSLAGIAVDAQAELRQRPSLDLNVEPAELTEAPPQPRFEPVAPPQPAPGPTSIPYAVQPESRRPKIVVPVSTMHSKARLAAGREEVLAGQSVRDRIAALPDQPRNGKVPVARLESKRQAGWSAPSAPYLVAAVLILGFVGMLLATHKYVTSHWNPFVGLPLHVGGFCNRPRRCYNNGCQPAVRRERCQRPYRFGRGRLADKDFGNRRQLVRGSGVATRTRQGRSVYIRQRLDQ